TKHQEIIDAVKKMRGVRKVYLAFGRFDIVSFVEAESNEGVARISDEIGQLEGVRSTETLVES
ncbi:MAG: Lrp/AsnC ligand binding domain-containing protein, partial [Candidatus Bathyarchaeia archaeon]